MKHALYLSDTELQVVYKLLSHVRLGHTNEYTTEISELMIELGDEGIDETIDRINYEYGDVELSFEFSDDEGMVINIV